MSNLFFQHAFYKLAVMFVSCVTDRSDEQIRLTAAYARHKDCYKSGSLNAIGK